MGIKENPHGYQYWKILLRFFCIRTPLVKYKIHFS
ncbi:hypothetical protein CLOBOL_06677 [Enterocloster bolteae ATCC BAA-613]|uniref:Uncharacterized protein n=1 Tax=Enterocloster bolteae (strain ATCC BAA-613 / DSM 15670 / CCUG 46953 / JCM 12243 / WAL 16351) TaxID=411902 RepID=A8S3N6_ENTBW|nr:hypothetical protein CLOBOL_06677 [Enterocloster bolteae ATCC BAA-613]